MSKCRRHSIRMKALRMGQVSQEICIVNNKRGACHFPVKPSKPEVREVGGYQRRARDQEREALW